MLIKIIFLAKSFKNFEFLLKHFQLIRLKALKIKKIKNKKLYLTDQLMYKVLLQLLDQSNQVIENLQIKAKKIFYKLV